MALFTIAQARQLNINAAYAELRKWEAEGQDVSGLRVNHETLAIEPIEAEPELAAEEVLDCPACDGFGELLGILGSKAHYACRFCRLHFTD